MVTHTTGKAEKWVGGEIPEDLAGSFLAEAIEAVRRNNLPEDLAEDWRQEMCLAVGLRLGAYQGALSSRRTFMVRLAKWRLQELVRETLRSPLGSPGRPMDSTCFPEDSGEEEEGESCFQEILGGIAGDDIDRINLKVDMQAVAEQLPHPVRRTYELLKTFSPKEVAVLIGKSVDTVYDHMAKMRKTLIRMGIYPANMRASKRKGL